MQYLLYLKHQVDYNTITEYYGILYFNQQPLHDTIHTI